MVNISDSDRDFIKIAIELATQNVSTNNGGPFGAIIVKDGEIIAKSFNSVLIDNDPTAHAEINAIRAASKNLNNYNLSGCTIYTSCEPCPMCLSAIYWARIDKIFFANTRQDAQNAGFDDNFIYNEFNKPLEARSIQILQIENVNGTESFKAWINKSNKKLY